MAWRADPVRIAVLKESAPGETRVAAVPETVKKIVGLGHTVTVQTGAGVSASYPDDLYKAAGAEIAGDGGIGAADLSVKVRRPSDAEIGAMKAGSGFAALLEPYGDKAVIDALAKAKIEALAMEFIPRISRAQSMDALSSQANLAGYRAVIEAATLYGRAFPMMMTAAGTIAAAKVFIMGVGVAGLQAIATARRLGAMTEGFDVRPETREQIESLGAKFLDLGVSAAGQGGYARELTAEERAAQQAKLAEHVKGVDVIVTTAAIPGRPSPKIIPMAMVDGMKSGAVIVDLAAEGGGNCEATQPGERVERNGVTIIGPLNLPSGAPLHASEMYARNLMHFIELVVVEGAWKPDFEDDLVAKTCVARDGEVSFGKP
ncbi:MAG TPA: Re/Si-specific NAD(P)(+) transhydrogenase subunit alpha [Rhodanobacteraceae bacterium]|nr:Re/Si-specific NAD(P)(+) transhydrogenase subunit alpha [Rhodanobacteraceae bacterium]